MGAEGSPSPMMFAWPVQPAEAIATMTSPICGLAERTGRADTDQGLTPSIRSSSTTMPVVGEPIIVTWTETGTPSTVPV